MAFAAQAQTGTLRGQVIDGENGEPLFAANARLIGTNAGASTDFDGYFEIIAEAGTYSLEISFIGMSSTTITGVQIEAGEVTVIDVIKLEPASSELDAVTITAEAVRNTEAALITAKRKSANVIDGISASKLRKIGDSDVGEAAKRVTGVTVEGGKYVYVRGLGDRYTKTMLNGVDIPGLDPDRNAIQIDIFPTNLISNMTILKTGLAELPADFAGGLVNIETKEFPSDKILQVSASVGYNPMMHFNSDYIDYDGSGTDFLGFDGGTRALPDGADQDPTPAVGQGFSDAEINNFVNSFDPTLGATSQTSMMDFSLGVTSGNQYTLGSGNKWGYIFSATYRNETDFYKNVTYGEYIRPDATADSDELIYTTLQDGAMGQRSVLLGGLAGLSYKSQTSKYRFTVMHLQSGESRSSQFRVDNNEAGNAVGQSGYRAFTNNLEYYQRGLTNILLDGEHHTPDDRWTVEWKVSPTISNINEPDLRRTAFTLNAAQGDSTFEAGQGGLPIRIWRFLDEINVVGKVDVTRNGKFMDRDAKIKFGASNVFKYREYEILTHQLSFFNQSFDQAIFGGDPNQVLNDEYIYPNGAEIYYTAQFANPNPNAYISDNNNLATYASAEFQPILGLKTIFGLRTEYFTQRHTGRSAAAAVAIRQGADPKDLDEALEDETVLDAFDLFPSANLIYTLNENMNLRGSYFRSIARPSFKELSFAQILDPASNRTFNGGFFVYADPSTGEVTWDGNLSETRINNFDVRWEYFMDPGEILSISGFYKTFDNPIELVRIPEAQTTPEFQPRNVGDGMVVGGEIEFTKGLDFIAPALDHLSFSGNFTYVFSQIDMNPTEFEARKRFEREGENIDDTREMAGQAPYVINAGFIYDDLEKGYDMGLFYNVKGRTLEVVGGGLFPDVYTEPFHSLNFSSNFSFGPDRNQNIGFRVSNILMDLRESFFVGFNAEDQVFSRFEPGIAFSLSYSYRF